MAARSGKRHELVEAEILERAAILFASRGFALTSLQDVADAMNISRPALYHYIGSKEELLVKLVEGVTFRVARDLGRIADEPETATQRLHDVIECVAKLMIEQPARFRLLERAQDQLPAELAVQHRDARLMARDAVTRIVGDGIREGVFTPCEPMVAAFAVLGMTNWIAWWVHSVPDITPDEIVGTMTQLVMNGLLVHGLDEQPDGLDNVSRAINSIKLNINQLETTLALSAARSDGPANNSAT